MRSAGSIVESTGGLGDSSMASRLTRKMIATRRRTDEDEQQPRRDIPHGGAHVRFLCFGAENRCAPGNAGDRRAETGRACGRRHRCPGSGSSKEQAGSGQAHCELWRSYLALRRSLAAVLSIICAKLARCKTLANAHESYHRNNNITIKIVSPAPQSPSPPVARRRRRCCSTTTKRKTTTTRPAQAARPKRCRT